MNNEFKPSIVYTGMSRALGGNVGAIPKASRRNAFVALQWLDKQDGAVGIRYVEGHLVSRSLPFPIEHGWLWDELSERVIDPTLVDRKGFNADDHWYIPGVELSLADIPSEVAKAITKKNHAYVYGFGFGGNRHEGYMNALKKGMEIMLAIQTGAV